MTRQDDIQAGIMDIVRRELDESALTPVSATRLADLPGWDSVTMSCVLIAVEQEYSIEFTPEEMDGLSDYGAFVQLIAGKCEVQT